MKRHIYVSLEETLRMTGLTLEQLKTIADEYGLYTTVKAKVLMIDILDLFHTIKAHELLTATAIHKDNEAFYVYLKQQSA